MTGDLLPISLPDQIAEVEREIKMRRSVYPHWVGARRLTQEKADRQLAVMEAVAETLKRHAASEGQPGEGE